MGTIVKFKPTIDYYYSRGLDRYEHDDYIGAIECYREAYRMTENGAGEEFRSLLEVEMACAYRNLHLVREAQLMFYKALCDDNPDASFDSVVGLIEVFGTSGSNNEALKYYMDMASKRGYSRELDYLDAAAQFFAQRDYHVEPSSDKHMVDLGKKLTEAGQYDFARQLLEVIPPDSSVYGEACMALAALHNKGTGDYEKALDYLQKAGDKVPTAEYLIHSALAQYKLGQKEALDETVRDIASIDTDDVGVLSRLIHTVALLGMDDLVISFGKKLALRSPQRAPMLCYAIALANRGELREARKILVSLQALFPFDVAVRVFSSLIGSQTAATNFSLLGDLPDGVENEMLGALNGALADCGSDRQMLRNKLREPQYRVPVLMVFQAGSDNSKRILADIVADIPFYERYIRDCLMDPGFSDADKRILLSVALKRFRRRPVYLTCRDVCRPLYGKPPAKTGARWKEVYCMAYGAVALFGFENFEREFDAAFGKLKDSLSEEEDINETAAAALLAHRLKFVPPLSDDECCIELFEADREKYFRYKHITAYGGHKKRPYEVSAKPKSVKNKTHEEK